MTTQLEFKFSEETTQKAIGRINIFIQNRRKNFFKGLLSIVGSNALLVYFNTAENKPNYLGASSAFLLYTLSARNLKKSIEKNEEKFQNDKEAYNIYLKYYFRNKS